MTRLFAFRSFCRLDYQPLFGKMSPRGTKTGLERAAEIEPTVSAVLICMRQLSERKCFAVWQHNESLVRKSWRHTFSIGTLVLVVTSLHA